MVTSTLFHSIYLAFEYPRFIEIRSAAEKLWSHLERTARDQSHQLAGPNPRAQPLGFFGYDRVNPIQRDVLEVREIHRDLGTILRRKPPAHRFHMWEAPG